MLEHVGPYHVTRKIGRGGMGVVYLGRDPRLDRDVAIKALPQDVVADPVRLERFEREGKSLAQLNHPNIAGIYGVEEQDGNKYLILEYVEGETLGDRLEAGPLPVDDALEIAIGIATGLEAAHDVGVIHRDLKPDNIKITPTGDVKILDFGLAKTGGSISTTGSSVELAESPTVTKPRSPTIPGAILGTAAYMSPEQARGRHVDKRTDIWSFGVLLFEMLTGIGPFVGETVNDSIGAVLHKNVDLDRLPPGTPSNVRHVLRRCLERDKNERYRDIGDIRIELTRESEQDASSGESTASSSRLHAGVLVLFLLLIVGATAGAWFAALASRPEPPRAVRMFDVITATDDQPLTSAAPKISPDGTRVAYIVNEKINVRSFDSFESQPIAGTDGAKSLVWSPDSRWIAFATSNTIAKVPAHGGGVTELVDASNMWAGCGTWTADDRIVATTGGTDTEAIIQVSARGGAATPILTVDGETEIDFHESLVIPNTNIILFIQHRRDGYTVLQAYDGSDRVDLFDLGDMDLRDPCWSPSGHVLFTKGFNPGSIWAASFLPEQMAPAGEPFLVLNDASSPSVSDDGTLVVVRGARPEGGELVWLSRTGEVEPIGSGGYNFVRGGTVSPDGSKIMFTAGETFNKLDVWIRDLTRGVNSRVTHFESFCAGIAWTPDGHEIAVMYPEITDFSKSKTHFFYADGSGESRPAIDGMIGSIDRLFTTAAAMSDPFQQERYISYLSLDDPSDRTIIVSELQQMQMFSLHPDGAMLAYASNESGKGQVYCTRTPHGAGKWQISVDGGNNPLWSVDGKTLYFWADKKYMSVDVTLEPSPQFGIPKPVFDDATIDNDRFPEISPTPDPDRFIAVMRDTENDEPTTISVIENWYEAFRSGR